MLKKTTPSTGFPRICAVSINWPSRGDAIRRPGSFTAPRSDRDHSRRGAGVLGAKLQMIQIPTSFLLALPRQAKRGGVIINEHTLPAAQTRRHVEVLGRWFDFIHLDELPRRLARPGRRPFCLLTFDDGKRSNVTETAPELGRLGVPAVFYVTTDFLTSGTPLWFDRHKALVRALGHCPAGLELEPLKRVPFAVLN